MREITNEKLLGLLREAADPQCTMSRRDEIQQTLTDSAYPEEIRTDDLLDVLYNTTLEHKPELLPSLYPAFALMCCKKINWLLA